MMMSSSYSSIPVVDGRDGRKEGVASASGLLKGQVVRNDVHVPHCSTQMRNFRQG